MKSNWKHVKLGSLCLIRRGSSPRPIKDYIHTECGMPWIKISDATESNTRYIEKTNQFIDFNGVDRSVIVNKGDLILSNSGTAGLPKFIKFRSCIHDGWQVFRKFNGIDKYFLYYYLIYIRNELLHNAYDSTMKNLTLDMLKEFDALIPDMITQRQIAKILSLIDDKIELNNKINDNLEQQAQAIFQSWFVDFEPFGGVMPADWEVGTLGGISNITSGKRPPMKQTVPSKDVNIPLVGAASIMGYTNATLYNEKILVTGRVGTHGVIQRFNDPCWTSDNSLVIKSHFYEFVYQVLKTIDYKNMNRGSTQPLITQTDLKNVEIVLPSTVILNKFETLVTSLMDKQESNKIQNQKLAQLRDTLLPRLMSGEIDVSEVEV